MSKRLLVCGGRDYNNRERVYYVLDAYHEKYGISVLIHGAARGADSLAKNWATDRGVPQEPYPAHWHKYKPVKGRKNPAGYIRNRQMLEEGKPDEILAFPGGDGTRMMCQIGEEAGKVVYRIRDRRP